MALQAKLLTINCPASTGNQAYTGAGFQPQALILFATTLTANGSGANAELGLGIATGSSQRYAWGFQSQDNVGTTEVRRAVSNAHCLRLVTNDGGTAGLEADLVSLDADGFTLNWSIVVNGADVHVLCLGGLDNAKAHTWALPTSSGSQGVTGVGFQAQALLALYANLAAAGAGGGTARVGLGVASGTGAQSATLSAAAQDFAGNAAAFTRFQTSEFLFLGTELGGTDGTSDFTSFDADGFTHNVTDAYVGAYLAGALCLRGLQAKVGKISVPGGTGSQATTGVGFQPKAVLLFGNHNTDAASNRDALSLFVGAATGASERAVVSTAHVDASDPTQCDRDSDTTKCVKALTAGTPTTDYAADLTSFDADGFTLNWSAVSGSDDIGYLALGAAAAGGGGGARSQAIFVGL